MAHLIKHNYVKIAEFGEPNGLFVRKEDVAELKANYDKNLMNFIKNNVYIGAMNMIGGLGVIDSLTQHFDTNGKYPLIKIAKGNHADVIDVWSAKGYTRGSA